MAYSLTYTLNSGGTSYSVTGYSNITTSDRVVIPATYDDGTNGKHLVTSIGNSAFGNCTSLTDITISNNVTEIGSSAFQDCTGLTSVTIGGSVTIIGAEAFAGCSSLTNVTLGNKVTGISFGAFENCSSLTSVTIPESVDVISPNTFSGCSNLIQLILFPFTPPTLGPTAIPNTIRAIYVRQNRKAAYQAATSWKTFANGRIVGDNSYLSFVRFNQKNKEYINEKINNAAINVVQTTGNSETDVMSQKAVTNNFLPATIDEIAYYNVNNSLRFNKHVQFGGSSTPTFINGLQINMYQPISYGSPDSNKYVYAPSESGRMAVEPSSNPTETSVVTVSSIGTHAYKKVSEFVDLESEQTLTGAKTWGTKTSHYCIAGIDYSLSLYRIFVERGIKDSDIESYTRCYLSYDGIYQRRKSSGSATEYNFLFLLPEYYHADNGTFYFSMTPYMPPTEPSVIVTDTDRRPTWKPVSELDGSGGNALKVTVW